MTANASFYRAFHASERRDGGPLHLRPRQRPVGHPRPADVAGGGDPQGDRRPRLRGRARLPGDRAEEHAAQRPSLPAGGRTPESDPPGHRGRHRAEDGRTPPFRTPNSASGGCSRRPRTASSSSTPHSGRSSRPTRSCAACWATNSTTSWARNSGRSACSGTRTRAETPTRNCWRTATSATSTCRSKTKSGDEVEVEFVSNLYMVGDRQVAQCNIRDITQRSRLERQAKAQAAALADLHRRKDEFLAMLSHELRNPLSPILNAVHLLRLQGDENLIQQEARSIIERQVGQLSRLIDDLLEVARFTSGKIRLQPVRLDMRGVVERAVESARPLIDSRRHTLTVDLPDEPIWLHADPTRLEQVVVNLLNNAAKYTDEGGRIWLEVRREGHEMVLTRARHGDRHRPRAVPRHLRPVHAGGSVAGPLARRAGHRACPSCSGSWKCTGGRWKSIAKGWGEGASSRSASRCCSLPRPSRPRHPRNRPSDAALRASAGGR